MIAGPGAKLPTMTTPAELGARAGMTLASTPGLTENQISNAYRTALSMASFRAGLIAGRAELDDEAVFIEFIPAFLQALYAGFE